MKNNIFYLFVWNVEGIIIILLVVDLTGKKPGRGAYLCRSRECLELARKGRKLERGLKCAIPDDIYEILEKELTSDK